VKGSIPVFARLPRVTDLVVSNKKVAFHPDSNRQLLQSSECENEFPALRSVTFASADVLWGSKHMTQLLTPQVQELSFAPPCHSLMFAYAFDEMGDMKELLPNLTSLSFRLAPDTLHGIQDFGSLAPRHVFAPFPRLKSLHLEGVQLETEDDGQWLDFSDWDSSQLSTLIIRNSFVTRLENLSTLYLLRVLEIDVRPRGYYNKQQTLNNAIQFDLSYCCKLEILTLAGFDVSDILDHWNSQKAFWTTIRNEATLSFLGLDTDKASDKPAYRLAERVFPSLAVLRLLDCDGIGSKQQKNNKQPNCDENPLRFLASNVLDILDVSGSGFAGLTTRVRDLVRKQCVKLIGDL
jgi:hypothetical protein